MKLNQRFDLRPLALVLSVGSALAAGNAPELRVSYQDLNLSQPADVRVLYHRLQQAAGNVCGSDVTAMDLTRRLNAERCYNAALERAVQQIDVPQLQALYRNEVAGPAKHG